VPGLFAVGSLGVKGISGFTLKLRLTSMSFRAFLRF